ncbi:hypothetical protein PHYPSEUDO_007843 [Phytophthora pseudosyringae]|uniref:TKL protein kinase n=1 Tax=Phytophthora pseudosyringae TaxID=221518 RepID=A0A8T1VG26_9STRA|nr:hypothetical protein PHYPSEUDO_007843 [Phytophthora pseudosyringae]
MAGVHQFWSIYEDSSCGGAPTGVFILRKNDCETQLASSSGVNCAAQYDSDENLVGYIDESCYDGRAAGLDALYMGEPYMAYDYYFEDNCTDFGNAASYRASGDCEPLYTYDKGAGPFRSATISISDTGLVWTRNMGSMDGALDCPGSGGEGYYEFDVSIADINAAILSVLALEVPAYLRYRRHLLHRLAALIRTWELPAWLPPRQHRPHQEVVSVLVPS